MSERGLDHEWDSFVDSVGADHVQTSRWAEVKAVAGWDSTRIAVRRNGELVGGWQLLFRRLAHLGAIAYSPRGPVTTSGGPEILEVVLRATEEVVRRRRVLLLKVQPPVDGHDLVPTLERHGFVSSDLATAPSATVRIDLSRSPDQLLATMRRSHRSNIRGARRKGVTVRSGTVADIPRFAALVQATARRQGFSPYPASYYQAIWEAFVPEGHATLLVAENDGVALSAVLLIAWGGCVTYKAGGWSGERTGVHPNELLHWTGIEWARQTGQRWYDLGGIDEEAGRALAAGRESPTARQGVTYFKLGFGGDVVVAPGAFDHSRRPVIAAAVRHVGAVAKGTSWLTQGLLGRRR